MTEDQNRTLTDKFMLRFPDGMRERIKTAAAANNRSMNAEIIAALEEKYPQQDPVQDALKILLSMSPSDQANALKLLRDLNEY